MRVHPSTRLTRDDATGQTVVEVRIEFFDHDSATSKAVGQLTLQLVDAAPNAPSSEAIETWNQDLRDLTVNQRQYDVITRTYLFRLRLESGQPPEHAELRAYFLSANGQELQATAKLRQ